MDGEYQSGKALEKAGTGEAARSRGEGEKRGGEADRRNREAREREQAHQSGGEDDGFSRSCSAP